MARERGREVRLGDAKRGQEMTHSEGEATTDTPLTFWYSESSGLKSLLTTWNSMLKWGSR